MPPTRVDILFETRTHLRERGRLANADHARRDQPAVAPREAARRTAGRPALSLGGNAGPIPRTGPSTGSEPLAISRPDHAALRSGRLGTTAHPDRPADAVDRGLPSRRIPAPGYRAR